MYLKILSILNKTKTTDMKKPSNVCLILLLRYLFISIHYRRKGQFVLISCLELSRLNDASNNDALMTWKVEGTSQGKQ